MDRRVKERLVGAVILLALIVSIVPELLPGPAPMPTPTTAKPVIAPEPVRNVTVDLATSKAPEAGVAADATAASSAQPAEARSAPAANATASAPASAAGPPPVVPPAHLETAAPAPTSPASAAKTMPSAGAWAVQLGSFASRANADKLMHQLHAQGFTAYLVPGGSGSGARYRVRVGPMPDRGAAAQVVAKLKSLGHPASFVPPAR